MVAGEHTRWGGCSEYCEFGEELWFGEGENSKGG